MTIASWLRRRRAVTLVIDDGPSEVTDNLLARLERGGHRAVLFVLGCNVPGREAILVDALRRGFALGNHSFNHHPFSAIEVEAARAEIATTERLIDAVYAEARVQRPGRWFRFPYLDTGAERFSALQGLLSDMGFERPPAVGRRLETEEAARLDWPTTLSTRDWSLPGEAAIRLALQEARDGDVIEFHDKPETVGPYVGALLEELASLGLKGAVPDRRTGWKQ